MAGASALANAARLGNVEQPTEIWIENAYWEKGFVMKRIGLLAGMMLSFAVYANAAEAKDEVIAAAKKLSDAPNYTWKTTVVVPEGQFGGGTPMESRQGWDGAADADAPDTTSET